MRTECLTHLVRVSPADDDGEIRCLYLEHARRDAGSVSCVGSEGVHSPVRAVQAEMVDVGGDAAQHIDLQKTHVRLMDGGGEGEVS